MKRLLLILIAITIIGCASFNRISYDDIRIENLLLSSKEPTKFGDYNRQKVFQVEDIFYLYAELKNVEIIDNGVCVTAYLIIKKPDGEVLTSGIILDYEGDMNDINPDEIYIYKGFIIPSELPSGRYEMQLEVFDGLSNKTAIGMTILRVKKKTITI